METRHISFSQSSASSCLSYHRWGVAMPFGCLTIGEKKDYHNPSDVTDKYDLGQIVKSWVPQQSLLPRSQMSCCCIFSVKTSVMGTWLTQLSDHDLCLNSCAINAICFFSREEFCEIFRAKDKTTMKMYTCKKFLKKDGRKVRKAAKNEILILKMWVALCVSILCD